MGCNGSRTAFHCGWLFLSLSVSLTFGNQQKLCIKSISRFGQPLVSRSPMFTASVYNVSILEATSEDYVTLTGSTSGGV